MNEFSLKIYNNLEEIIAASFGGDITPEDVINDTGEGWVDNNGQEMTISWESQKDIFQKQGYWGFVDNDNVIHIWIYKEYKISFEELLFFFGHEMGHKMGNYRKIEGEEYDDNHELHFEEERRADEYGLVATKAYEFAKTIIND